MNNTALPVPHSNVALDLSLEEWRDVVGYVGQYQVSDLGRVKSLARANRLMTLFVDRQGYLTVSLRKPRGVALRKSVHRLVAMAFIPNRRKLPQVNHLDGNKTNARVENLEWVTRHQNQRHAIRTGLLKIPRGEARGHSKLTEKQVLEIRKRVSEKSATQRTLAFEFNISPTTICEIIKRKKWAHL
jgi:NUMOD4 motif/HNH endonuclease